MKKESLYHKLLVERNRMINLHDSKAARIIKDAAKLQTQLLSSERLLIKNTNQSEDSKLEILFSVGSIDVMYNVPKFNAKIIWLKCEEICDLLKLDLSKFSESQTKHNFNIWCFPDNLYCFNIYFYFAKECIPIYEMITKEEQVLKGYRCE